MAKFNTQTPLSLLLFSCMLSYPTVNFSISSLPVLWKSDQIPSVIPYRFITFILSWCMCIQYNNITPAPSQNYMWHPITNKLSSFTCWC